MEIRAVTLFIEPHFSHTAAGRFFAAAGALFHLPLQSSRLAFTPFPDWLPTLAPDERRLASFAASWRATGADYLSLGPVRLHHDQTWIERLPQLIGHDGRLFAAAEIAAENGQVDVARCRDVARVIKAASHIDDGFGNLYFAALAHCPSGSPFFPVAYQQPGAPPAFALALEAADLALEAFRRASSLSEARRRLQEAIETEARRLQSAAEELARDHNLRFAGLDFSLAPYPQQARSLAAALEALGLPHLGAPGSLFAAAFVADAIDRARFPRCGFCGLMLPVLEDAVLARRAAEQRVSVSDLLGLAAVCGVGLDTVPLPGDISEETLAAILLDVAALAARLRKPLTARLMPLPGLTAGDPVHFDFPYFADSRVMAVAAAQSDGLLSSRETLAISPLSLRRSDHVH